MRSMQLHREKSKFIMTVLSEVAGILFLLSLVSLTESVLRLPEFSEPIKNMTLHSGSDVEFSCGVRHLGTYRVTWSWKKEEDQKFLAIGTVKITHNPRVHISRIQKSDDVTQFNLYVYNVKKEDDGAYYCSVNSNPMIEQIGTLEVIGDSPADDTPSHYSSSGRIFNGRSTLPFLKEVVVASSRNSNDDANVAKPPSETTSSPDSISGNSTSSPFKNSSGLSISQNEDSATLCIDFGDMWESARERISEFLKTLMKFTYSYWLS